MFTWMGSNFAPFLHWLCKSFFSNFFEKLESDWYNLIDGTRLAILFIYFSTTKECVLAVWKTFSKFEISHIPIQWCFLVLNVVSKCFRLPTPILIWSFGLGSFPSHSAANQINPSSNNCQPSSPTPESSSSSPLDIQQIMNNRSLFGKIKIEHKIMARQLTIA